MKRFSLLIISLLSLVIANAAQDEILYVNFAEMAKEHIQFGTIGCYYSSNVKYSINNRTTYTIDIYDSSNKLIYNSSLFTMQKDNIYSYINEVHNNTNQVGLLTNSNQFVGIIDLKANDRIEIAYYTKNTIQPSSLYNAENPQKKEVEYVVEYKNGKINYTVYSMEVKADGNAGFSLPNAYVAYLRVYRETEEEIEIPNLNEYATRFETNYAKTASDGIRRGSALSVTLLDNNIYSIGSNNTQKFYLSDASGDIIDLSIITTNHTISLDNRQDALGLYNAVDNLYGILDLKKSDVVEIAVVGNNLGNLINLKEIPISNTEYEYSYADGTVIQNYKYVIKQMLVQKDGHVGFWLPKTGCIAYIKVLSKKDAVPEYYLIGDMTKEIDDWAINPSYKFVPQDDGITYKLTVGSIKGGNNADHFQIATVMKSSKDEAVETEPEGNNAWSDNNIWFGVPGNGQGSSINYNNELFNVGDYKAGPGVNTDKYDMYFDSDLVNVTFTFCPNNINDATLGVFGTAVELSDKFIISAGNDQTMQSGEVNDDNNSIELSTVSDGATVIIYVPSTYKSIYYELSTSTENKKGRNLNSNRLEANLVDHHFSIRLPIGNGEIRLYEEREDEKPVKIFNYTVTNGIPTHVEKVTESDERIKYFNLQGIEVQNPEKGNIYIKVERDKISKILL